MRDKSKGFTLIEMMAALVVFASGTGLVLATSQSYVRSKITTKLKIAEYSTGMIQKSNLARGVNAEELNMLGAVSREYYGDSLGEGESRMEFSDRVIPGKATISWAKRDVESSNTIPAGFMIFPGSSGSAGANALEAPVLKHPGGVLDPSWFPSRDFVSLPSGNPSGTSYHFTQDGSDPDTFSTVWTGQTVVSGSSGGVSISDVFRVMAYHPDPMFGNSSIITGNYFSPPLAITMGRSDGGNSLLVNYNEIAGNTNRIVLNNPFDSSFGTIHYAVNDNREPTNGDTTYSSAFHLAHSEFDSTGAIITAKYIVRNPYFENTTYQTFNLQIDKIKLPNPSFSFPAPFFSGNQVTISVTGDNSGDGQLRNEQGAPAIDPSDASSTGSSLTINYN